MCTDIASTISSNAISDASSDSFAQSGSSGSNRSGTSRSSGKRGVFHEDYHTLCQRHKRQPLNFFKLDPRSSKYRLRLCADKITFVDWELVLGALRYDSTLVSISVLNRRVGILKFDNFDSVNTREKAQKFDRVPVILTRYMMLKFAGAVAQCLSNSDIISDLRLEALPLRPDCVSLLCKGLHRNSTLTELALPHCTLGDEGCIELCRALKNLPNIKVLNLTACGLTAIGIESVVELIKSQQLWRTGQCWEQGLRSQKLDPESISGLRRVTLNYNAVGDEGALRLINTLADDNFIKAVDMQSCDLTERIVPDLLELIEANNQLMVFDVRCNQVSEATVRRIYGQFQVGRVPSQEWRWIRAEAGGVWRSCGSLRTGGPKTVRSASSDGSPSEVSTSVSADSTCTTQSSMRLSQSRVWSQMYSNNEDQSQSGSADSTKSQCGSPNNPESQCGCPINAGSQCGLPNEPGAQCELHTNSGAPSEPPHNCEGADCPVHTAPPEQGMTTPAALQMALSRLIEFASAAESVVGPLENMAPVVVCHTCACEPKSVSFDLEKGDANKAASHPCPDTDANSLITLDRVNAHSGQRSEDSLMNEGFTGHGDICPLHPTGPASEATVQIVKTSLKDAIHQTLLNSSWQSSGHVSLQTSLAKCMTQTFSNAGTVETNHQTSLMDASHQNLLNTSRQSSGRVSLQASVGQYVTQTLSNGTVETERQTSLNSLMRWNPDERTGLFSGSDESILHAVFLGRNRTRRSDTDSSDSNCTVSSLSNESSTSNSTGLSNTTSSGCSGASAGAHSSRATFVRLLLKKHNLASASQASSCNQVPQNVGSGKLLQAIS